MDTILGIRLGQFLTALEARDHANDLIEATQNQQSSSLVTDKSSSNPKATLTLDEEAKLRVQVLEQYVRPALLPNESWGADVSPHWQFYPRLVRWLRQEYLGARFGPHVRAARQAYPALAQSPQFSLHIPPTFQNLPNSSLVQAALCTTSGEVDGDSASHFLENNNKNKNNPPLQNWATTKNRDRLVASMQSMAQRYNGTTHVVRGGALCWNDLPTETSLAKVPLSHILHLVGANVLMCSPLNTWLEQRQQFQFWTKEYIASLGNYLMQRCQKLVQKSTATVKTTKTIFLEVGAGDGLLTALLQDYVQNHYAPGRDNENGASNKATKRTTAHRTTGESIRQPSVASVPTFIATDNESWSIRKKATVVKLSYEQALEKYANDDNVNVIALCSWMPMNDDWTATFREHPAVQEYILIGEADDGQCGDNWETWGNPHFLENDYKDTQATPPFRADGFERKELSFLLPYQFSRYDSAASKEGTTVSFRRKK